MERRDFEGLTREELIARAEGLGVPRPRTLTRAELMDEILTRTAESEPERARARGFLGRARDLLSRVVERGLHLPETARALCGAPAERAWPSPPLPFPTITLAEIYSAQGHAGRALAVLDEVLARDPEHKEARHLHALLLEQAGREQGKGEGGARSEVPAEHALLPPTEAAEPQVLAEPLEMRVAAERVEDGVEPPVAASVTLVASVEAQARLAAAIDAEVAVLPERYDVDEIVGMPLDPETIYLYWEVRPTTLARARARHSEGQLVVRLVAVLPSWDGPVVEQRDVAIDALFGDVFVRGIPSSSNIRMSTGWLSGEHFEPFAVGLEIAVPRALPSSSREQLAPRPAAEVAPMTSADPPVTSAPAPHPAMSESAVLEPRAPESTAPESAVLEPTAPESVRPESAVLEPRAPESTAPESTAVTVEPGEAGMRAVEAHDEDSPVLAMGLDLGEAQAPDVATRAGLLAAADVRPSDAPEHVQPWNEAPQRFPSGTVPTPLAVACAVAATRGGSSELGRSTGGPRLVEPRILLNGLDRPPALGTTSELWRVFGRSTRSTPERS